MRNLSRRHFFGAGAVALAARSMAADPLGMPIGCQTYPVRDALGKDVDGTLRHLAALGYRRIEMCSPAGYERSGYGPLLKYSAAELRKMIQSAGLGCESCHFQFAELKNNLPERIAFAKDLGLKQMVLSTFGIRRGSPLSDWMQACDDLNRIAAEIQKAGMQTGFHNHNFEFEKIDGELVYDRLMTRLDPKLVKMQFQVSVISLGYEAATYLEKYPGRFISLHLQDWSPAEKKEVAVGKGEVNWANLFAAAKKGGVKNYFVELPMDTLEASYQYLHGLKA